MSGSLNTHEILTQLFLNSDKSILYNSLTVSKKWNDILSKEYFWKQYYERNFLKSNSLNKLRKQMPNHTYKNLCKYKMANKNQLVSNFYNKESFLICNLNNIRNLDETEPACVKQDCMVWFDKENLSLKYLEFNNPEEIREFPVGSNIIMVDIIDNLIVCINVDYRITIFSRIRKHNQWHINLINEPEHENGELFIINSCILDNLITLSFFELIHQEEADEENEDTEHQGDFKIIVWDLNLLSKAINSEDITEDKFYDVKIKNIQIPITFNPVVVHNCAYQVYNEKTGELVNRYYILSSTADDGIISVFMYDDDLQGQEIRNFFYDLEDDVLLWASIHADGTILAIGKKEIEIFSINDDQMDQHRKISSDIFESFNLYDIILTPELLYIIMFVQGQNEEEEQVEPRVRFAVLDISNDIDGISIKNQNCITKEEQSIKSNEEEINISEQSLNSNNEITNSGEEVVDTTTNVLETSIESKTKEEKINIPTKNKIIVTEWSKQEVCFNKFVETGIVHYEPKLKQVFFTPFSNCFCKK
ncbi:hypothetical protein BCR36DRAFT_354056 [Piromyces finnis]|uniref:F-box domain-containing protein n=1 Tax=Piromyces finnis TaxID=1754191 RepID=A0A1Y1V768_9FUNG|nr:hypothetical protein BCR36DRAFT_354056 [Piromyces finnis]|eukprot:ORX48947.1 hypothetical protein BCR36DRAFT_354056 [Piromyces finnis]